MTRHLLALFVCALTTVGAAQIVSVYKPPTPEVIAERRAELQRLLDAYAGGDYGVVRRSFGLRLDSTTRVALDQMLNDPAAPWQPARAAFTLEVAVALRRVGDFSGSSLLRAGRTQVLGRPDPIGTNAKEDRFEVLWHQVALAFSTDLFFQRDEYLNAISARVVRMAQVTPPIPNRFALARAETAKQRCCNREGMELATVVVVSRSRAFGAPPRNTRAEPTPGDALALYDAAASDPALRAEALIRKAYLEQLLGRPVQSLEALDAAGPVDDQTLGYAAALIRAGSNDRLGRPADAADAYATALKLAPDSQVPAIGYAAALQRSGRPEEAVAAADRARQYFGNDPWPAFGRGDYRYVEAWLAELRTLLK